MTYRPTIRDLAAAAGVSVATVDRVLNGRQAVREQTAQRVYQAALALDYHAVSLVRQRVLQELPVCRLGLLFQPPDRVFYQMLARHIEQAAQAHPRARIQLQVEHAPLTDAALVVEKIRALAERNQAVALVAPDYPLVATTIEALKARGIAVFSLLSDVAKGIRNAYVGVNNHKVGRTAGWFIARTARAEGSKVACFVGSHRYHGHDLREMGLRSYFRECAPGFQVVETLVNLETDEVTHEATLHLLKQHPDLAGIYVVGGGAEGAVSALHEAGKDRALPVVVSEQTPSHRTALADGTVSLVLATPLRAIAEASVNLMVDAVLTPDTPPGDVFVPFEIHCPESI